MTERKPKRPGRPPLDPDDPKSVNVHFRLPPKQYDDVLSRATRERLTLADYLRRRVRNPPDR